MTPGHCTVQEGLSMVSCREGITCHIRGHVNCGDEHSQATFDQRKVTGTTR